VLRSHAVVILTAFANNIVDESYRLSFNIVETLSRLDKS
jgi:hypothetical protein